MKEKSAQRLIVFVPPRRSFGARQAFSAATAVDYVALGAADARDAAGQAPVTLLPKAAQTDLVFDCGDVFTAQIDVPRLSDAKLRQALPNLLEDRLLANPADCQYAFEPPRASGDDAAGAPKLPVAVIDRGLLTQALDALSAAGHRPRAAYSEIYTVPAPAAGVLAVRADRGRGIARSGRHDGFAFDLAEPGSGADAEPAPALLLAVRQLGIKRIVAYGREAERVLRLAGPLGVAVDPARRELDEAAAADAVNLLQGAFAQRSALGSFALARLRSRGFKAVAVWSAVALLTWIAGLNLYWFKLTSESRALRAGMQTSFRSAFPQTTAVVDPVLQTKRQLADLRARAGIPSAEDFTPLNARAAQLLSMAPIGSVAGVEYRDGVLSVKFKPGQTPDAGLQNRLRAQAVQLGLALRFDGDGTARLAPAGQ